ncbi:hypothetical protein Jiend_47330 [Micromonospora endophytica]|nr:hypothetical protein Jiend_47330 [Micromonospora endophytica]
MWIVATGDQDRTERQRFAWHVADEDVDGLVRFGSPVRIQIRRRDQQRGPDWADVLAGPDSDGQAPGAVRHQDHRLAVGAYRRVQRGDPFGDDKRRAGRFGGPSILRVAADPPARPVVG